jgi:predicted MPP superfamily phosphohydrolase
MLELYVLIFFIVLSSLFACSIYFVSGDIGSPAILSAGSRTVLVVVSFVISLMMLFLAISERVHKNAKHVVFFVLLIYVFIFLCFVFLILLRLFGIRINMFKTTVYVIFMHFCLYCYGFVNKLFIRPTFYEIRTEKDVNMRIVFVSDVHIGAVGSTVKLTRKIIDVINAQEADLVLFGGDTIETKVSYIDSLKYAELFRGIRSRLGVYAILGNHEYYMGRINMEKILKFLIEGCGMRVLLDESVSIDKNLLLLGRLDGGHSRIMGRKRVEEIMADAAGTDGSFRLLLDHNPKYFDEAVANGVDLQLSGHTHNGQMFPFNLLVKFIYEKPYGRLEKSGSVLIVSSGVSTWGPPIKICSKPEVVVVNIVGKSPAPPGGR